MNSKLAVSGMNTTVSARIGTLSATAAEGEPMRKPRAAGTNESSIMAGMFMFASVVPMISEAPDDTVTFLSSIAAKAAKVTSHTALFFRVFLNTVAFVFVIAKIVITPASVATAMFMFSAVVKKTVMMIGKNEISNSLRSAFVFVSVFVLSVFWGWIFLKPMKYPTAIMTITTKICRMMSSSMPVWVNAAVRMMNWVTG